MLLAKTLHPPTCLCGICVSGRLDGVRRRDRSRVARQIIEAASAEDLLRLSADSRQRLREALSLGFAPEKERDALDKILMADLIATISPPALVVAEYQKGMVIKGDQEFVEKTQTQLDCIAR